MENDKNVLDKKQEPELNNSKLVGDSDKDLPSNSDDYLKEIIDDENDIYSELDKADKAKKKKSLIVTISLSIIAAIVAIVFLWRYWNGVGFVAGAIASIGGETPTIIDPDTDELPDGPSPGIDAGNDYVNKVKQVNPLSINPSIYVDMEKLPQFDQEKFMELYFGELYKSLPEQDVSKPKINFSKPTSIVTVSFDYFGITYSQAYQFV